MSRLTDGLKEAFGLSELLRPGPDGIPTLPVTVDNLKTTAKTLKEQFGFSFLSTVTGLDLGDHRAVVYTLRNLDEHTELHLKVAVPTASETLPTLTGLWRSAEWQEREVYDLLGIHFLGHPDLRRILLPQGWVGHPLRKDYTATAGEWVATPEEKSEAR